VQAFSSVLAASLFVLSGSANAQIAPHSVSLSWTASTSSNVGYYKIYRGTTSGEPYRLLTSPPVAGPAI
jgi:fibronectin type 3 domain-containing protein